MFLSKLLEKISACIQFVNYLRGNCLLPKFQSPYGEFFSTENAMIRVINDILRPIDSRSEAVLVLLDLSSAFDTLDHQILLERLKTRFGVEGSALSWFRVILPITLKWSLFNNSSSSSRQLMYSVPQGSVLGPLLFTLYFAPVEDVIRAQGIDCMFYAADIQLYVALKPTLDGR